MPFLAHADSKFQKSFQFNMGGACCGKSSAQDSHHGPQKVELTNVPWPPSSPEEDQVRDSAPPLYQYTYDELSSATKGFTSRVIRDDARGTVYQGCIVSTGLDVAVLVLKPQDSIVPDFKDEVEELAKRRHKHLISLDGYYKDGGKGILVFNRIVNATSVHDSLHNRERGLNPPVWKERVHVALYVSQALRFLHRKGLVYGHVAASNVLLSTFRDQIKLADLRYLGEAGHGDESGYHAPEYTPGDQTKEAEVYSFGVLLLELVTGQKPYDENRGDGKPAKLVEAIRPLLMEWKLREMVDPGMGLRWSLDSVDIVMRLVLRCTRVEHFLRPFMEDVEKELLDAVGLADQRQPQAGEWRRVARDEEGDLVMKKNKKGKGLLDAVGLADQRQPEGESSGAGPADEEGVTVGLVAQRQPEGESSGVGPADEEGVTVGFVAQRQPEGESSGAGPADDDHRLPEGESSGVARDEGGGEVKQGGASGSGPGDEQGIAEGLADQRLPEGESSGAGPADEEAVAEGLADLWLPEGESSGAGPADEEAVAVGLADQRLPAGESIGVARDDDKEKVEEIAGVEEGE